MTISLLGELRIDGGTSGLGPRDRVVLGVLSIRPGQVVTAEALAAALWGGDPPPSGAKVVQGCIVRLRKALGPEAIETTAGGYRLTVPPDDIDAARFERLAERSRELLALGEHDRAAYTGRLALELWRGAPLRDLDGWESGRIEAGRLDELRLDVEEIVLDAALQAGRHRDVLPECHARVAETPRRERRWALLALAQYQAGQQADALRTLAQSRRMLLDRLGVDPGPALRSLELAILNQDPSLTAAVSTAGSDETCPYPGLVPYDVDDADSFFGRAGDVARGLELLERTGVLAVVGPSGCGKTSLVRAGIAASLRRRGQGVRIITPGDHPMRTLAALPTGGPTPTLIVDQLEEAVTQCEDPYERRCFLAALVEHAGRAPLVVALRADRLGDVTVDRAFARTIERGLHLLGPMSAVDLQAAIESPARQVGLRLEPGLVDLLQRDVDGEPGGLPLLAHALRRTWEEREARTLTVAGYRSSGGIRGAVARSAEEVYAATAPADRPVLRDVVLRLVTTSEAGEPHRVKVPRRLVATDPQRAELVERLVAARLVTSDDESVELAHESLVRAWPRLRTWLDDDADGQRIRRRLSVAADDWEGLGRAEGELYRGARLARAEEWQRRSTGILTPLEQDFLDASRAATVDDQLAAQERIRQQTRANRRLRVLATGAAVLLALALVAGVLAVRQARRADTASTVADARRVGAQALATPDVDRSLLLAVEAVRLDDSAETRASLLAAVARDPWLVATARAGQPLTTVDVSPDGRLVAAGGPLGVTLHDATTLEEVARFDGRASRVRFRPDGAQLAVLRPSGQSRSAVLLLDLGADGRSLRPAGAQLAGVPGSPAAATDVAFSLDGATMAVAFDEPRTATPSTSEIVVWATDAPSVPPQRIAVPGRRPSVALAPDGTVAYVGTEQRRDDRRVAAYAVATGALAVEGDLVVVPRDISPDGRLLAAVDHHDAVLLDASTLTEVLRIEAHEVLVDDTWFSPDGRRLVTAATDGTVTVWDVQPWLGGPRPDGGRLNRREAVLTAHAARVDSAAFAPDGRTLVTAGADGALLAWDLAGDRRFAPVVPAVAREPGPELVVRAEGATVQVEERATRRAVGRSVPFATDVALAFPDATGRWGAVVTTSSGIVLVDFVTGTVDRQLALPWTPTWAAFSPDSTRLAVTGRAGEVGLLDVSRGRWIAAPTTAHRDAAITVDWAPDATTFATGGEDGRVGLWDGRTGALIGVVPVEGAGVAVRPRYADDGTLHVTTGRGPTHRVETDPARWADHACAVAGRSLSAEEWADALGDRPYHETCG